MILKVTDKAIHFKKEAEYETKRDFLFKHLAGKYLVEDSSEPSVRVFKVKGQRIYCRIVRISSYDYKNCGMRIMIDTSMPYTYRERGGTKVSIREMKMKNKNTIAISKIHNTIETFAKEEYENNVRIQKQKKLLEMKSMQKRSKIASLIKRNVTQNYETKFCLDDNKFLRIINNDDSNDVFVELVTGYSGPTWKCNEENMELIDRLNDVIKRLESTNGKSS